MKPAQTCSNPLRHAGLQRWYNPFVHALEGCCSLHDSGVLTGLRPDRREDGV